MIYGSAWLPGTTAGDVINGGLPFTDIFDTPPANGEAYTGNEILYYSEAIRSPYTYDTMEHLFYDVCAEGQLRQPENCVACVEPCDSRGYLFPVCTVQRKNDGSLVFKSLCANLDEIQFHRTEFYGTSTWLDFFQCYYCMVESYILRILLILKFFLVTSGCGCCPEDAADKPFCDDADSRFLRAAPFGIQG
jgi:hypothetical protein